MNIVRKKIRYLTVALKNRGLWKTVMQSPGLGNQRRNLEQELASREHNLAIIEETIQKNPRTSVNLSEVRDMLVRRVEDLNAQLAKRRD